MSRTWSAVLEPRKLRGTDRPRWQGVPRELLVMMVVLLLPTLLLLLVVVLVVLLLWWWS